MKKETWSIYKIVDPHIAIKSAQTPLSLILMSSGHTNPMDAERKLEELLEQHKSDNFTILPIYNYTNEK